MLLGIGCLKYNPESIRLCFRAHVRAIELTQHRYCKKEFRRKNKFRHPFMKFLRYNRMLRKKAVPQTSDSLYT
jgi:hypothetical protein